MQATAEQAAAASMTTAETEDGLEEEAARRDNCVSLEHLSGRCPAGPVRSLKFNFNLKYLNSLPA